MPVGGVMNKLLALCTALLLSGGTAQAADASLYSPAPAYDWSGIWVGAQAGYVSGSLTDFAGTSSGPSGADVGLHGYYNFQRGNWVFGPYFELPLGQADGTTSFGETKLDWAFTGGFRLGYAFDRWLPYGGLAGIVGGASENSGIAPTSNTHTGYALLLGVDYGVTERWSVGARYAHVSMSKEKYGGYSSPVGWDADSIVATLTFKLY